MKYPPSFFQVGGYFISNLPMNKTELALSLIRAPWAKRLTDRSFILAVVAAFIGLYLFQQKAISGDTLTTFIATIWAPWILGNQAITGIVGGAAVKDAPDTVNAGGDVNLTTAPTEKPKASLIMGGE